MRRAQVIIVAVCGVLALAATSVDATPQRVQSQKSRLLSPRPPLRPPALSPVRSVSPSTPSQLECVSSGDPSENVQLDCDTLLPNNEPHIAVDPTDPSHMVASSNDYDQCCDAFYTTFNGGKTWHTGNMSVEPPGGKHRTGSDPVTSFDRKHHVVIHASINYLNDGCDADVVVSISKDGGLNWNKVVQVADGGGPTSCFIFNDKEWITTDNNPGSPYYGRSYATWTRFLFTTKKTKESPILEAHSDDGGRTWTTPHEISGSNAALCTFQEAGAPNQCDEDQFSVPTVGPDGTVYVSFINDQNQALWEPGEVFDDQYLLVRSTDGGKTWSAPAMITDLEDGSRDFPINVDGRQTLTDYQLRAPLTANVVADPTQAGRLYFAFEDNRNGLHDVDNPVTNTDVFLTRSDDGGSTWGAPVRVNGGGAGAGNDQWFPFVNVNPTNGTVGVIYNDRGYGASHRTYQVTLSESTNWGASFASQRLSTAGSHPRKAFNFQAQTPQCWHCSRFNGDYISLAYDANGRANAVWTDMRVLEPGSGLYLQFIEFARR
jgi:hypothetical protein